MTQNNWKAWIQAWGLENLFGVGGIDADGAAIKLQPIDPIFQNSPIEITDADRKLAWNLYQELHTRVATRELHFRSGNEQAALKSVYELFGYARQQIKKMGPECYSVAALFMHVLNGRIERFTSKWHKRSEDGDFSNKEVCRVFRLELYKLQQDLAPFKNALGRLANSEFSPPVKLPIPVSPAAESTTFMKAEVASRDAPNDQTSVANEYQMEEYSGWPATTLAQRKRLLEAIETPLESRFISSKICDFKDIEAAEKKHIESRRSQPRSNSSNDGLEQSAEAPLNDAIGLSFSGGGIRASTFAMGVTQRLVEQGLLRDVDYLSTVSGGGYFGTFLSSYLDTKNPKVGLDPRAISIS